jgi:hypothetical protein
MGAANGFITEEPDTRYGDAYTGLTADKAYSGRFTVPDTGATNKTVLKIGCYISSGGTSGKSVQFAIFTHDSGNGCPETIVTNSQSDAVAIPTSMGRAMFTYSTNPTVTRNTTYWICSLCNNANDVSRFDTGGVSLSCADQTYPTFPTGDAWHTHTDGTRDTSYFVVYQDEASGETTSIILAYEVS